MQKVNLAEKLASFVEAFSPKIVAAHVLLSEPRGTPNTGDADATPVPEVEI